MGNRYRSPQYSALLFKAASFVLLFSFLFQPLISFAQVVAASSDSAATPITADSSSEDTASSPSSTDSPTAASDSGVGNASADVTPDTASNSSSDTSATALSSASAVSTNSSTQTTGTQSTNSTNTNNTGATQSTSPITTATPDTSGVQPLLAPSAPGDGTESVDLTRKSIDPKYYSETDPVTGSLSYTYPVTIPPGRNGLQPDADLGYTSQPSSDVNIMGYGWDTQIPYIERINKMGTDSLYAQNYFYSSIDGELYQTATSSSTWGARVESGSFNQYQLTGATSTAYWTMTDKNGTVYTFGTTTASRLDNPTNGAQIYKWELEKVQDANGNYVTYQYAKDEGEIYPFKITYTNASSTPGIFEIDYATTTRADIATSTADGFPVVSEWLINAINVKVSGVLTHNYAFTYTVGANGMRSLLNSITESGYENGATTTLPAVQFNYTQQTPTKNWDESSNYVAPVTFDPAVTLADVNGDGLIDIIHSESGATSTTYLNNGSNGWTASSTWTPPMNFWNGSTDLGVRMVDVNGDGLPDIVQSFYSATSSATTTAIYINTGNGWVASSTWSVPVAISSDTVNDLGIRFVDVNGDGLPDIIQSYEGIRKVYINNGNGWTYDSSWTVPVDFVTTSGDNYVRIEDVNGDGLPDLVQANGITGQNNVWINTGSGWTLDPQWTMPVEFSTTNSNGNWIDTGVRFMDVNGDGLPDLVQSWSSVPGYGGSADFTWINTGHGWVSDPQWATAVRFATDETDDEVRFADVNGDGMIDLISSPGSTPVTWINNAATPDLLSKVTFADGGSANYTYEGSQQYRLSGQVASPNLPISLDTVSGIALDNGLGVVASTSYSYQGGKYYYGGPFNRQFAGFQKVVKTDAAGGITNTYYHQGNAISDTAHGEYQDAQPKIGKVYRTESYDNAGNLYAKSIFKWDMNSLIGGREFVDQLQEVDSTYDGTPNHTDKATSYTYDMSNGDVLSTTNWGQVTGSDNGTFTDTGTDSYTASTTYATSSSPYIALPDDKITTSQNGTKVNETQYYYDNNSSLGTVSLGNLTKTANWISGTSSPIYASSTIAYNSYGLPTSKTDALVHTTTFGYDSYNLYAATTTNPLSQSTYATYDYPSGQVATSTNPNGSVYATTYDGLGRPLYQYEPSTASATSTPVLATQYIYNDTAFPSTYKLQYFSAATSSELYSYFDGFGRIMQSRLSSDANILGTSSTTTSVNTTELVVGGGGGGGSSTPGNAGGGGGGGGIRYATSVPTTGSYPVVVGSGGASGSNGGESVVFYNPGYGGGGGGVSNSGTGVAGNSGASGGGGSTYNGPGGSNISGQGTYGGSASNSGNSPINTAGGGGGAGSGGGAGGTGGISGQGGVGLEYYLTTTLGSVYSGGGGGGATSGGIASGGGNGGGGAGGYNSAGTNGTVSTGGGGGGAGSIGTAYTGGSGGSGIVIISYPTTSTSLVTCGGSLSTNGSSTVCTYTSNGTFTVGYATTTVVIGTQGSGDNVTTDYQYNNLGLLSAESLPYFSAGTAKTASTTNNNLYSYYAYDPIQRVKTVTNAVGSTQYAYNNWTTTITDADSHLKDLSYDAYGNLIKVTEHNGASASTTQYTYDGNANLTKLTDALGNVRNFTYDGLNDELTSQDLHNATDTSFGTWTYTYDAASNKLSSLDPKSQTINYTYDALNRELTENYTGTAGVEKTYVYDTCTNGIGELCSVGTASATTTYAYDPLGHTTSETENVSGGGSPYTTKYSYDQQGNVLTQTYPDSSLVTYAYNSLGQIYSVTDLQAGTTTPTTIIAAMQYGPDGQVTYQRDGNSVETFNTYNQNALYRLTYRKTVGPGTGHLYTPMFQMMRSQTSGTAPAESLISASPTNPIEVPSARTANSRTYFLGKSSTGKLTYTTQFAATPLFTSDTSGNMVPVGSNDQMTTSPTSVNITKDTYSTQIQDNPISNLFTYTGTGGGVAVAFDDSKASVVAPTQSTNSEGAVFTYANSLGTGEGLEVVSAENYLQKNILLTQEPANPSSATNYSVTFKLTPTTGTGALDVSVDGELLSKQKTITSSDEAEITTANGIIAYIWPPEASDSSAVPNPTHRTPLSVTYRLKADGSILVTKNIPYSWLATAIYPVRADLTFSGEAGGGDGWVQSQPYPGSWATQHSDTTGRLASYTDFNFFAGVVGAYTSTGYLVIDKAFMPFDTSSLPDNAVISSSTLNVYVNTSYNQFPDSYANMNVYQGFENSPTAVINSDISQCGNAETNPTQGASNISLGSISSGGYTAFNLNSAGMSWITATGTSEFCLREGHDTTNNAISYNGSGDDKYSGLTIDSSENGTSTAPYLSITYTIPDTTPGVSTELQAEDQTNPINVTDTSPHFSATYNDTAPGNDAIDYEIQMATSTSGFGSPLWDSGELTASPSVSPGTQSQDFSYTGTALALDHTTYYWRIKFWDVAGNVSPWSDGTANFTMADDGTHIQSLHYTYDPVGNITGILDDVNGGEQSTFTYDSLNRLLTASSTVSGFQTPYYRAYTYDPLGNIASSTDNGVYYYQGNLGTSYADPDAVTSITNNGATTNYTYDNNGNLLSDGTLTDIWNYLNQLTQVGKGNATSTYAYDYQGNRVLTTDTTGTTLYPNKYYSVTATSSPTSIDNIYANGTLVASLTNTGTTSAATTTPLLNATSTSISVGTFASTTRSWQHAVSFGLNRLLVLTASILQSVAGTGSISSASFAGLPLTKAAAVTSSTTDSELWYLIAPPSGNNTITVNTVGSTTALKFSLSDYTGINQLTPFDATSTATSTTGNPTISLTSHLIGDLAVDTLNRASTTTASTNKTPLFADTTGSSLAAASYQIANSTSISDTYTGSASQPWALSIAAFRPATTTPTTGTTTTITYLHQDQLGSSNAVTNSSGLLTENLQYYPYGSLRTDTISGQQGNSRKFLSQLFDSQTNLNYLNARYLASQRGGFLSEDPVFLEAPSQQNTKDPQSLNAYSYAGDNPIIQEDPTGRGWDPADLLVLGAIFTVYNAANIGIDYLNASNEYGPYANEFSTDDRDALRLKTSTDITSLMLGPEFEAGDAVTYGTISVAGDIAGLGLNNIPQGPSNLQYSFPEGTTYYSSYSPQSTITSSQSNLVPKNVQTSTVNSSSSLSKSPSTSNTSASVNAGGGSTSTSSYASLQIQIIQLQIELLQLEVSQIQKG